LLKATTTFHILNLIKVEAPTEGDTWSLPTAAKEISFLYSGELNPVNPKAQKLVPVPEGLDLDAWIHELEPEPEPESDESDYAYDDADFWGETPKKKNVEEEDEVTKEKVGIINDGTQTKRYLLCE
jgi:hypothetical protein